MEHQTSSNDKTRLTAKSLSRVATLATLLISATLLAACGVEQKVSVSSACDVFTDSLRDVNATTEDGEARISKHFESGVSAGCWRRK